MHMPLLRIVPVLCISAQLMQAGCATTPAPHGTISTLSQSSDKDPVLCQHKVPKDVCTRCNPALSPRFQKVGDWCVEHAIPESQCLLCHPDLTFTKPPEPPEGADVRRLSTSGEDVPSLEAHAVKGKVTVFDFYADWCAPCRKIDGFLYEKMQTRKDIAYRKLNMVNWDSPLSKRHLAGIPNLPYVIVYKTDGTKGRSVTGLDLAALDLAITDASRP